MKTFSLTTFIFLLTAFAFGNNIQVTNVTLINQNTSEGVNNANNHTFVRFTLTWDNSWRTSTGPGNYDAAWVFVKFQPFGGNYQHATLSSVAAHHSVTTNNGITPEFRTVPDGVGIFIQRANDGGPGSINWQDVMLRWNYRANNVHDTASVTVQVFAVEMVFIPQGAFYIGDGNIGQNSNGFRRNNVPATTPQGREAYLVTSENQIIFQTSSATSLASDRAYDPRITGHWSISGVGYTLPEAFPKGFNAFYTMKYEISQKQYVDFFNTLPTTPSNSTIKTNRSIRNNDLAQTFRNNFNWTGNNLDDATLTRLTPSGGSGDRACNNLSSQDILAYLDWSALRPMTELEYEKMCRGRDVTYGPIYPINGEFAWGNNSINSFTATTLTNDNSESEGIPNPATSQVNCNGALVNLNSTPTGNTQGVVRCGIFAAKNHTSQQRRQSGASFYGVMELTGNVTEFVISTIRTFQDGSGNTVYGHSTYTGNHGDGVLLNGEANFSNLPSSSGNRGGSFMGAAPVSSQSWLPSGFNNSKWRDTGGRGVRSVFN
jgi:formylglycine-generating enzyme required for sulfatase activity